MGFIKSILGNSALKTIALQGVAVPIIATVVGYTVQKELIKRDTKRAIEQQNNADEPIDVEVVEVNK